MTSRRKLIFSAIGGLLASSDARSLERNVTPQEADLKAALVFNICRFVEWPTQAPAKKKFLIGVFDRDEVGRALEPLVRAKQIAGLPVEVRRIVDLSELLECSAIFLPREESRRATQILGVVRRVPVLTVSEVGGFLSLGGMIGLFNEGERVHFEIRTEAAERVGLRVSSKLMRLATDRGGRP